MLVGVFVWGNNRLQNDVITSQGRSVRVALIQGNIPQEQKWDDAHAGAILNTYLSLTRDAAAKGAQLVIWPESSTPFTFEGDPAGEQAMRALAVEVGVPGHMQIREVRYYAMLSLLDSKGAPVLPLVENWRVDLACCSARCPENFRHKHLLVVEAESSPPLTARSNRRSDSMSRRSTTRFRSTSSAASRIVSASPPAAKSRRST